MNSFFKRCSFTPETAIIQAEIYLSGSVQPWAPDQGRPVFWRGPQNETSVQVKLKLCSIMENIVRQQRVYRSFLDPSHADRSVSCSSSHLPSQNCYFKVVPVLMGWEIVHKFPSAVQQRRNEGIFPMILVMYLDDKIPTVNPERVGRNWGRHWQDEADVHLSNWECFVSC